MDIPQFTQALAQQGFAPAVTVTRAPGGAVDDHAHPFEAKALVLAGDIRIVTTDGTDRTYRQGEVFHLQAGARHTEFYGAEGVTYLVGRKALS